MPKSSNASPAPPPPAVRSTVLPPLLTIQQGEATRRLLSHVASLRLADADAQLLAVVIAIRAVRAGSGNITGQNLDFVRLEDTPAAVAELASLGWQFGARELRSFIVQRLITNEWLTNTPPVPWTLRPGKAAQTDTAPAAVLSASTR